MRIENVACSLNGDEMTVYDEQGMHLVVVLVGARACTVVGPKSKPRKEVKACKARETGSDAMSYRHRGRGGLGGSARRRQRSRSQAHDLSVEVSDDLRGRTTIHRGVQLDPRACSPGPHARRPRPTQAADADPPDWLSLHVIGGTRPGNGVAMSANSRSRPGPAMRQARYPPGRGGRPPLAAEACQT